MESARPIELSGPNRLRGSETVDRGPGNWSPTRSSEGKLSADCWNVGHRSRLRLAQLRLPLRSKHACLPRNYLSIAFRSGARDPEKGIDQMPAYKANKAKTQLALKRSFRAARFGLR